MKFQVLRSAFAAMMITLASLAAALFWNHNGTHADFVSQAHGMQAPQPTAVISD